MLQKQSEKCRKTVVRIVQQAPNTGHLIHRTPEGVQVESTQHSPPLLVQGEHLTSWAFSRGSVGVGLLCDAELCGQSKSPSTPG